MPAVVLVATVSLGLSLFSCSRVPRAEDSGGSDATTAAKPADTVEKKDTVETIDPTSVNATCYVCHMTFVKEDISKVHFKAQVTCIDCHGLSADHANDEDIGATKPDVSYRRDQVDEMCAKCHAEHDVPPAEVVARFVERKPAERPIVCTDCHGTHRIEPPQEEPK